MIYEEEAVIYFSSEAGRRYFSKKSAIDAETRAVIKNKYPTEKPEYENGQLIYPGFYWESDIKRADVIFRRLRKVVKKSFDR